jgi:hypothetical protein
MPEQITVAGVDLDAAVQEAAEKLGIKVPGEKEKPAPSKKEKQPAPKEEEVVEEEVEETEEDEAEEEVEKETPVEEEVVEEEEIEEEKPKSVPISRFNEVYAKMRNLERAVEILQAQPKKEPPKVEIKTPDFENMTEVQKAEWILKSVSDLVDSKINEKVGPVISKAELESANRDVQQTAAKHADFKDYTSVMIDIANRHPSLGAEEVYQLAKALNPGKKTEGEKKQLVDLAKKAKAKMVLKKKANVEKRSSARERLEEKKEYKGTRDAGLAVAEKLGLK